MIIKTEFTYKQAIEKAKQIWYRDLLKNKKDIHYLVYSNKIYECHLIEYNNNDDVFICYNTAIDFIRRDKDVIFDNIKDWINHLISVINKNIEDNKEIIDDYIKEIAEYEELLLKINNYDYWKEL